MGTDELSGKSDEMVGENVLLNSIPYRGGGDTPSLLYALFCYE